VTKSPAAVHRDSTFGGDAWTGDATFVDNQGDRPLDIDRLVVQTQAQSHSNLQNNQPQRPDSPITLTSPLDATASTSSPSTLDGTSILGPGGPNSGSLFKHKLNQSVALGKGNELPHSPSPVRRSAAVTAKETARPVVKNKQQQQPGGSASTGGTGSKAVAASRKAPSF